MDASRQLVMAVFGGFCARRILIALFIGGAVASIVFGLAASLDIVSDDLGAGDDDVAACDTDGVSTTYTVAYDATANTFEVTEVVVDGIDATNCTGQDITLALTDGAGAELVTAGPTAISGATVTVPVTASVLAEEVEGVHIAITGDDPTP
jgi:hypothetical protein